jgi:hypothetical protein
MLVLDEPTNYLDRESLGALASGINEYGGAVVMISHNSGLCVCVGGGGKWTRCYFATVGVRVLRVCDWGCGAYIPVSFWI